MAMLQRLEMERLAGTLLEAPLNYLPTMASKKALAFFSSPKHVYR